MPSLFPYRNFFKYFSCFFVGTTRSLHTWIIFTSTMSQTVAVVSIVFIIRCGRVDRGRMNREGIFSKFKNECTRDNTAE